jgi:hypothetical protein
VIPGSFFRLPLQRLCNASTRSTVIFVIAFGLVARILLWRFYGPAIFNDSLTYWRLANLILESWSSYDGTRVPVYPFFLALVGSNAMVVVLQLGMGIFITMGLFYIAWAITRKAWFAALAAMAHQLNLGQLFFEASILTETMATFWVILALVCLVYGMTASQPRKLWLALLAGTASALALLTRPLFIVLPPWLCVWMVVAWQSEPLLILRHSKIMKGLMGWLHWLQRTIRRQWLDLVLFWAPVFGLVLGWMGFIHHQYGDWALSTMTGYHLIQHTGAFFEYVPDEYAALRDVYLEHRDARIAQFGTQANTIWEAIPQMMQASGLNFYDLSRAVTRISVNLIWEHPDLYFRSIINGWWLFWRAPVYWSSDALRMPETTVKLLSIMIHSVVWIQRIFLFAFNLLFILTPAFLFFQIRYYRRNGIRFRQQARWIWIFLLGLVWLVSFLQAVLDHGDNPRFLIPLQSLVVTWALWQLIDGRLIQVVSANLHSFRVKFLHR